MGISESPLTRASYHTPFCRQDPVFMYVMGCSAQCWFRVRAMTRDSGALIVLHFLPNAVSHSRTSHAVRLSAA